MLVKLSVVHSFSRILFCLIPSVVVPFLKKLYETIFRCSFSDIWNNPGLGFGVLEETPNPVYASRFFEIVQDHLPNAHCFADDTQLYLSFDPNSPTDQAMALEAMERCISDLRKWMYRDKLKINDDKTEFLVIGSRQQLLKIHHCSVRVGTIDIKPVKVARNLGAWFDSHFSMSNIFLSCSAAFFWLHNIKRISQFLPRDKLEMVLHAFVTSRIDYCKGLLYR